MGIGPFLGTFIGGALRDSTGSYRYSMLFALGSFILSAGLATTLPRSIIPPHELGQGHRT
jgi:hypothetical protein